MYLLSCNDRYLIVSEGRENEILNDIKDGYDVNFTKGIFIHVK